MKKTGTVILVTHKISLVHGWDWIIGIDKGSVVGAGRHEQLLSTNKTYRNMVTASNSLVVEYEKVLSSVDNW